jgi:hypothetical protein
VRTAHYTLENNSVIGVVEFPDFKVKVRKGGQKPTDKLPHCLFAFANRAHWEHVISRAIKSRYRCFYGTRILGGDVSQYYCLTPLALRSWLG